MSSNPFRRSSFKDSGSTSTSRPGSGLEGISAAPLSVNTRVLPSQKHVEFASPPAIPISPASYPSSPESTRQSPAFRAALPSTPDYSEAIQSEYFREATLADEHDVAIEQAVRNARTNSEITTSKAVQKDAVKDTLSRFASGPRKPTVNPEPSSDSDHWTSKPQKQALDVDAFKRLLLTGESTPATHDAPDAMLAQPTMHTTQLASDSNSSTTSLQRSILEGASQETPRSSIDQETGDGDATAGPASQAQEARRKPPPPKPRYGKPINESTKNYTPFNAADAEAVPFISALHAPTPSAETPDPLVGSSIDLDPSEAKKRPPTPPLSRRKSQNKTAGRPNISRNLSSRNSVHSAEEPTSPAPIPTPGKMPPPPPPMRRMNSQASRKASTDLPAMEEEEEPDMGSIDRLPMLSKRISLNPPPPPPPRRARGSSRSSLDGSRPSIGQMGTTSSSRSSGEYQRPSNASMESRKGSGPIDILADLAALQREVDAARGQAGR